MGNIIYIIKFNFHVFSIEILHVNKNLKKSLKNNNWIYIVYIICFVLVNTEIFANLSNCKEFGLIKCENLVLDGGQGKLGAW